MKRAVILVPEARLELKEAFDWYQSQEVGLGLEFLISADAARTAIEREPETYAKVFKDVRKALVQRFPFCLFYVERGDVIYILAVFHARRDPKIWRQRAQGLA